MTHSTSSLKNRTLYNRGTRYVHYAHTDTLLIHISFRVPFHVLSPSLLLFQTSMEAFEITPSTTRRLCEAQHP